MISQDFLTGIALISTIPSFNAIKYKVRKFEFCRWVKLADMWGMIDEGKAAVV